MNISFQYFLRRAADSQWWGVRVESGDVSSDTHLSF